MICLWNKLRKNSYFRIYKPFFFYWYWTLNICYLSGFVNIYQKTILSFGHKNRICCCLRHSLHIKRVLYTSKKLFPLLFGCFSSESANKQNAFLSISVLANKFQQCTFFLRVLKQANLLSWNRDVFFLLRSGCFIYLDNSVLCIPKSQ